MPFSSLFTSNGDRTETVWTPTPTPNSLSHVKRVPLKYSDSLFFSTDAVWIYPGRIDKERYLAGVAKAMSIYPHIGGRINYDKDAGEWYIDLAPNQGLPSTFATTQRKIGFLDPNFSHEKHSELIDLLPLPIKKEAFIGIPLLKMRVVWWPHLNQTSIAQSWFHGLGDGATGVGTMTACSEHYKGNEPMYEPTYELFLDPKYQLPPDAAARGHALGLAPLMAHIPAGICGIYDMVKAMWHSKRTTLPVRLNLRSKHVKRAQQIVEQSAGKKISPSLAVSAYLLHTLNSVSGQPPIRDFQQVLGTRQFPDESIEDPEYLAPAPTSAGNAIIMLSGHCEEENPDIGQIAGAIRKSATSIRDPEALMGLTGLRHELFDKYIKKSNKLFYLPRDKWVAYNNQSKIPWTGADFGYTDQCRFYLFDTYTESVFTFFEANPVQRPDGSFEPKDEGALDVSFRLQKSYASKFLEKVEQDLGLEQKSIMARL